MINVGTMIASAIFIVPATVMANVHTTGLSILAWVVGGIVSLLGALCYAELGSSFPHAGGEYFFLRSAYGKSVSFPLVKAVRGRNRAFTKAQKQTG